jgi:nucleotide-binding universal stress UspA family protein
MLPLVYDPAEVAAEETRILAEALAGWQTRYPDVTVHQRLIRAHAGRALVEATGRAQLVVVGTHGHQAGTGWLVGSVTHTLLHQAHCPILVVPRRVTASVCAAPPRPIRRDLRQGRTQSTVRMSLAP